MESINLFEAQPKWERPRQKIQVNSGVTIAFSTKSNSWVSRYSFTPSCYMNVGSELLSNSQTVEAEWALNPGGGVTQSMIFFMSNIEVILVRLGGLPHNYIFSILI